MDSRANEFAPSEQRAFGFGGGVVLFRSYVAPSAPEDLQELALDCVKRVAEQGELTLAVLADYYLPRTLMLATGSSDALRRKCVHAARGRGACAAALTDTRARTFTRAHECRALDLLDVIAAATIAPFPDASEGAFEEGSSAVPDSRPGSSHAATAPLPLSMQVAEAMARSGALAVLAWLLRNGAQQARAALPRMAGVPR